MACRAPRWLPSCPGRARAWQCTPGPFTLVGSGSSRPWSRIRATRSARAVVRLGPHRISADAPAEDGWSLHAARFTQRAVATRPASRSDRRWWKHESDPPLRVAVAAKRVPGLRRQRAQRKGARRSEDPARPLAGRRQHRRGRERLITAIRRARLVRGHHRPVIRHRGLETAQARADGLITEPALRHQQP